MHIATGGITASMDDAPLPVRGLAAEQNLARFIAVERRAQIDELAQPRRAVASQQFDRRHFAQAGACHYGVGGMRFGRIVRAHRAGDTALRPDG